ncbi:MAG: glycosyltransferase [Pyrinomonadaceae bacterium]|nr:glycosyltransferase [Pyrinomonadaceae bacterium]
MSSKLNILQLVGSFNQGGTERQAVQLTRLLHATGRHKVFVACLDPAGPLRRELEELNLKEIPEFPLTSFYDLNTLAQWRRFGRFCRHHQIDLIHVHDFYTNIFGVFGALLGHVPIRIASRRETDPFRSPAQRFVEHGAYNLAQAIVANSEAVKEQLISEGISRNKIVTVYNGMDTTRVKPLPEANRNETLIALGLPTDSGIRFVTMVANMRQPKSGPEPYKDQPTFLRAAKRVLATIPNAAFVVAGEGELMPSFIALASSLGIAERTFFIGRCAQMSELLAISDVCVLSSKSSEGFSNSIIEYMAAARPVVATDVGGAREQIVNGRTGFVVQPGDDLLLAEHVVELLKDRERARGMGQLGLARVREMFSLEIQLRKTEELYEVLAVERLHRPASVESNGHALDGSRNSVPGNET